MFEEAWNAAGLGVIVVVVIGLVVIGVIAVKRLSE